MQVLPGLYVGNYMDSRDKRQLEGFQITHVLTVMEHSELKDKNSTENHMYIEADDKSTEDLSKNFQRCNDFIHAGRQSGGNVLIHCRSGKSRSVTIATAYIMSTTAMKWKDALDVVMKCRPCAKPNNGFLKQLEKWDGCGNIVEKIDKDVEFCMDILRKVECVEEVDKCFFVNI